MFQPPSQSQEAAIGGQENIDLCFRSEYDFQLIAETYRELVKLVSNVPKFSELIFVYDLNTGQNISADDTILCYSISVFYRPCYLFPMIRKYCT